MELKQRLIDYGCSPEFVAIALGYEKFYPAEQDIEPFIEYVEMEYAKVEAAEEEAERAKRNHSLVDAAAIFREFEEEEDATEDLL